MTLAMTMLAMIIPTPAVIKAKRPHFRHRTDPRLRVVAPYNAKLDRMAACESSDDWSINTGNGFYGGLQFLLSTWYAVGGRGMPNQNSELEQKYRAVILYRRNGSWGAWPRCGYV